MPTALLDPPPAQAPPDFTALRSFAALRGQLRVSLTPRCNINCWFCHDEGDTPPWLTRLDKTQQPRQRVLTAADYTKIIAQLVAAGLDRVYFTGGEPLVSPMARPVLEAIPKHEAAEASYTLITNGLLIKKNLPWLRHVALDKVKVSLHYFSDASLAAIAATKHGIAEIIDGIELVRDAFPRVELNTLLQRQNAHEIHAILDFALQRRLGVQFIELVDTGFNAAHKDDAISADDLIAHLRTLTHQERVELAGVGQGKRVFTIDGTDIEVIHKQLGRHHVGQCGTCPLRPSCVEGFWALRLDHAGLLAPCLLRDDLRLNLAPYLRTKDPVEGESGDALSALDDTISADSGTAGDLATAVAAHVQRFTEGTL
jgi:cyclic pyranopterin phosphate synthase